MRFVVYTLLIMFYENNLHIKNKGLQLFEQHHADFLSGFDLRHKLEPIDNELLANLSIYKNKKELLDKLTNKKINIRDKCKLIEKYDIIHETIGENVCNGGLLEDWDFEL